MHKRMALTATGTGSDAPRERHHRHQRAGDAELPASDSVELSHNSRLVMDETTRMQQEAMAEAPSSIGLWVVFVLAGVVYAVLAPLTTRRSTQSACS
jgi:hypothetical protein